MIDVINSKKNEKAIKKEADILMRFYDKHGHLGTSIKPTSRDHARKIAIKLAENINKM